MFKNDLFQMEAVLGWPLLGPLLGVSGSSLRRCLKGGRPREDDSRRARFLAMILADVAGSYDEVGQRLWFMRPRAKLGGRAPVEVLAGEWTPEDPGPRKVAELARWLRGGTAT